MVFTECVQPVLPRVHEEWCYQLASWGGDNAGARDNAGAARLRATSRDALVWPGRGFTGDSPICPSLKRRSVQVDPVWQHPRALDATGACSMLEERDVECN